jgi:hypothetical protein
VDWPGYTDPLLFTPEENTNPELASSKLDEAEYVKNVKEEGGRLEDVYYKKASHTSLESLHEDLTPVGQIMSPWETETVQVSTVSPLDTAECTVTITDTGYQDDSLEDSLDEKDLLLKLDYQTRPSDDALSMDSLEDHLFPDSHSRPLSPAISQDSLNEVLEPGLGRYTGGEDMSSSYTDDSIEMPDHTPLHTYTSQLESTLFESDITPTGDAPTSFPTFDEYLASPFSTHGPALSSSPGSPSLMHPHTVGDIPQEDAQTPVILCSPHLRPPDSGYSVQEDDHPPILARSLSPTFIHPSILADDRSIAYPPGIYPLAGYSGDLPVLCGSSIRPYPHSVHSIPEEEGDEDEDDVSSCDSLHSSPHTKRTSPRHLTP